MTPLLPFQLRCTARLNSSLRNRMLRGVVADSAWIVEFM